MKLPRNSNPKESLGISPILSFPIFLFLSKPWKKERKPSTKNDSSRILYISCSFATPSPTPPRARTRHTTITATATTTTVTLIGSPPFLFTRVLTKILLYTGYITGRQEGDARDDGSVKSARVQEQARREACLCAPCLILFCLSHLMWQAPTRKTKQGATT